MYKKSLLEMTGHEYKKGGFDKAVLPLGSTEFHGDHLPHGSDTIVSEYLAKEVSKKVEGLLVLPTLPYGMSRHYSSFPLTITLNSTTLINILKEIFQSLLSQKITRLLIINGHDGNIASIETATREYRVDHPEMKIAVLEAWWETAGELLPKDTFEVWNGLGHAGEGETSINLAINPQLVDITRARGTIPHLPEHIELKWIFHELTPYGVTGDPTKATAEKGRKMIKALVNLLVSFIGEMDANNWNIRSCR